MLQLGISLEFVITHLPPTYLPINIYLLYFLAQALSYESLKNG